MKQGLTVGPGIPLVPWGIVGLALVPLSIAALAWWATRQPPAFSDIDYYRTVLPALFGDAPMYEDAYLVPHKLAGPVFWDQAPSAAIFAAVLALPFGEVLWAAALLACAVAALLLMWPRVGLGGTLLLANVILVWLPTISLLVRANLNSLVLLCLVGALRWPKYAGWSIGIAISAKLIPVFMLAWLVGRRDWRQVALAVAIPVVMTVAALALTDGLQTAVDFVVLRLNQTTDPDPTRWSLIEMGLPEYVAYSLGLSLAFLAAVRASFSLAVVAMLVAIPAMHVHYWTWVLVPLLMIWYPWIIRHIGERGQRAVDDSVVLPTSSTRAT